MPAKLVDIGYLHFYRKGEKIKLLQGIFYTYESSDRVTVEHEKILTDLISMHPEDSEKTGPGIESFSVRSGDYGTQCFRVNRSDGTSEKFSFKACLSA